MDAQLDNVVEADLDSNRLFSSLVVLLPSKEKALPPRQTSNAIRYVTVFSLPHKIQRQSLQIVLALPHPVLRQEIPSYFGPWRFLPGVHSREDYSGKIASICLSGIEYRLLSYRISVKKQQPV